LLPNSSPWKGSGNYKNSSCRVSTEKRVNFVEELYLLGYNAVYFVESQPIFQRNISLPSSELKSKPSKKPA
jgi:hypothetical protein